MEGRMERQAERTKKEYKESKCYKNAVIHSQQHNWAKVPHFSSSHHQAYQF
jgi:hypothetical protein